MSVGTGVRDESTAEKILETINIAMMEHRRRSLLEARPVDTTPADTLLADTRLLKLSASDCSGRGDIEERLATR